MSESNKQSNDYHISLESFAGPLDLLLFLIQKTEVDIFDIPIAKITEQYLSYLDDLKTPDLVRAGDFLVMAATLLDIKTRMMLPLSETEDDEAFLEDDPREDLVLQLLEYRKIKAAALQLEERSQSYLDRFPRGKTDRPEDEQNKAQAQDSALVGLEMGDLVAAFSKVLRDTLGNQAQLIALDDVPVAHYVEALRQRLATEGACSFGRLFEDKKTRAAMVGNFLAILELIRLLEIRVEQSEDFGDIMIYRKGEPDNG